MASIGHQKICGFVPIPTPSELPANFTGQCIARPRIWEWLHGRHWERVKPWSPQPELVERNRRLHVGCLDSSSFQSSVYFWVTATPGWTFWCHPKVLKSPPTTGLLILDNWKHLGLRLSSLGFDTFPKRLNKHSHQVLTSCYNAPTHKPGSLALLPDSVTLGVASNWKWPSRQWGARFNS